jgi:motility quorum-sensing regulator/GCU-specific mRNA interferase toxin
MAVEQLSRHVRAGSAAGVVAGGFCALAAALVEAAALGLDFDGIVAVIMALTPKDFHKSMTAHADHRIWQDVYRPTTDAG